MVKFGRSLVPVWQLAMQCPKNGMYASAFPFFSVWRSAVVDHYLLAISQTIFET
jgi:hypothetical protein